MAEQNPQKPEKSAVIAGTGALNNPNLAQLVDQIKKGYKPHRTGKSNRQIRIDNTAMIENDRPIWAYKTETDTDGNVVREVPQLLWRAGWWLSPAENHIKEELLKDKKNKQLNEAIWAKMEESGLTVEKKPAQLEGEKVLV